jgi:predicted dehydrogenase
MNSSRITRRRFAKTTLGAFLAPTIMPSRAWGEDTMPPPSDRVTVGLVGLGGIGMGHVGRFLKAQGAQVVAVCDVHQRHYRDEEWGKRAPCGRAAAQSIVEDFYADRIRSGAYKGCDAYVDYRELCARDDIDAVVVATPDHWHALCALEALRNGKDVYCEKPVTHLFGEGQRVVEEVAKRKAIFQTGSQQRSMPGFRHCVELVRNERIGKLIRVEVGLPSGPSEAKGDPAVTEPPERLDYDLWCGPSEKLPYMRARHHRWWRFHRAYGGGNIMDWIGHHNDIAHWGMDAERSGPVEVAAAGEWTWAEFEGYDTPVDYEIQCRYANGVTSSIGSRHKLGVTWIGEEGWIRVNRSQQESSKPALFLEGFDRGPVKVYDARDHVRNFLDGIRRRKECIAPAEIGHRSITPGHLGYVSQELGRRLRWDPAKEAILGDMEADKLLKAVNYRSPWKLPV